MVGSYHHKFWWKLKMLAEAAETVSREEEEERIIVNIPRPENRDSTPEWLVKVLRQENGYDPKLITTRSLFKTDLDKNQSCLSIPFSQVVHSNFLTEEETTIIEEKLPNSRKEGLRVALFDPRSNKHHVDLRKWGTTVGCKSKYVLNKGWNDVVAMNRFNIDDIIQIWSFRVGRGKLCLALSPPTRSGQGSSRHSSKHTFLSHK